MQQTYYEETHGTIAPTTHPRSMWCSVAMDFIGLLPEDDGFVCIVSFTDWLNSDIWIIPTCINISAEDLTVIFFKE